MHVTVVDDIQANLEVLEAHLEDDFDVELIQNPLDLIPFIESNKTDLVLLDLHMPEINGFDLYQIFKQEFPSIPVIFLSGDSSDKSIVRALDLGAGDFIIKPVSPAVLVARINSKIYQNTTKANLDHINMAGFTLKNKEEAAIVGNKFVQLTPIEYKIIHLLAKSPNTLFSKDEVTEVLWPDTHVVDQNIDTHLSNLRKKLKPFSENIKTIKSRGYILRV